VSHCPILLVCEFYLLMHPRKTSINCNYNIHYPYHRIYRILYDIINYRFSNSSLNTDCWSLTCLSA